MSSCPVIDEIPENYSENKPEIIKIAKTLEFKKTKITQAFAIDRLRYTVNVTKETSRKLNLIVLYEGKLVENFDIAI